MIVGIFGPQDPVGIGLIEKKVGEVLLFLVKVNMVLALR